MPDDNYNGNDCGEQGMTETLYVVQKRGLLALHVVWKTWVNNTYLYFNGRFLCKPFVFFLHLFGKRMFRDKLA